MLMVLVSGRFLRRVLGQLMLMVLVSGRFVRGPSGM